MPADIYDYTPVAITAKRRGYGKPYSARHSRTARSVPVFAFDFTQAPPREFAPQPDNSIDQLENELRRLSLKADNVAESKPWTLAEERKKFEAEKRRFEADKREFESRVRVAEHKAAHHRRRYECMRQELDDIRQDMQEAQDLCFKLLAEKDTAIEERDLYIANLLQDGRAIIQQKDQVIAALKAQSAPETMHVEYPVQPQQHPSQYTSPSSQDEQYDPSRPQFVPYHTHAAPTYPVQLQQEPSYQGDIYHQPQSHSAYSLQSAPDQDVSMDWFSAEPSVQTVQVSTPVVNPPHLPGADKAAHRAIIENVFSQPNWRWWMVGVKMFRRCMWVYEDEPEILQRINEFVANVSRPVTAEAESYRVQKFVPYIKRRMEEKRMRVGRR